MSEGDGRVGDAGVLLGLGCGWGEEGSGKVGWWVFVGMVRV